MANIQKRLVLTGAYFGRDLTVGNRQFVGGVCDVSLDSSQFGGVLNYVRHWGAFEIGTPEYFGGLQVTFKLLTDDGRPRAVELAGRIEQELVKHGYSAIPEAEVAREADGIFGHLFPAEPRDNQVAGVSDLVRPDKAPQGQTGESPDADSGPEVPAASSEEAPIPASAGQVKEALGMIDPSDDDLWTKEGQPKITSIEDFYDGNDLTRKLVTEIWPEFNRELARSLHGENLEQATG